MNPIKICDHLPGSGKTSAFVNLMLKSLPNKRFIYLTFPEEIETIKAACESLDFVQPHSDTTKFGKFTNLDKLAELLKAEKNIIGCHSLLSNASPQIKELINDKNYTLIVDEIPDFFNMLKISWGDIDLHLRYKTLEKNESTGKLTWLDREYDRGAFKIVKQLADANNLIESDKKVFYWCIPDDMYECFKDVFIATYMFEHQLLRPIFQANKIPYEYLG